MPPSSSLTYTPYVIIASSTINAARIIGVDKRVGSLGTGKDADVVLYDGDPVEYITRVCGVIVSVVVASEECT